MNYDNYVFTVYVDNYLRGQSPRPGDYSEAQLQDFVRKGQLVPGRANPPVVNEGLPVPNQKTSKKG